MKAARKLASGEQGFTLVEMLVTIVVMMAALLALHSIFDMSLRVFSFGNDKLEAVQNARLGMDRLERELQGAYPVDKTQGHDHLFFAPPDPSAPALPPTETAPDGSVFSRSITFGIEGSPPNRRVDDNEVVTYYLDGSRLMRLRGNSTQPEPVIDHVEPGGLTFTFFTNGYGKPTAAGGTDVGIVRIALSVNVDGRTQTLTTDVDLRNR